MVMGTVVGNSVQMSDKARFSGIICGHIQAVRDELNEAYGKFGQLRLNEDDYKVIREAEDRCRTLEGQALALAMVEGLVERELG